MDFQVARFFIKIAGLLNLLGGILLYALGVGIAKYLGTPIDWVMVSLGQIWITTYQIGTRYLTAFFHLQTKPRDPSKIVIDDQEDDPHEGVRRDLFLWAGFASFAATTSVTLILIQHNGFNKATLMVMGLMFLLSFIYAVPPFNLVKSGYGELILSITIANLIPAMGFMLQYGEIHRLVTLSTFPLTTLYLAMTLALQLPHFSHHFRVQSGTMLVRLGWEKGMYFHNLLILASFLVIGAAMIFGLPSAVALPAFFVFPLGLFQIWYMTRIARGSKPIWRALNLVAILTFGLTAYLIAFSFWIR